jgi:outer membrane protein assembly factor BamB
MEERPVMGAAQDEHVWPTQPQPLKPPPVGRMSMTRADLNTMTPEIGRHCAELWDREGYVDSTPYAVSTPEQPVLRVGGAVGGWGPMSYNADLGYVFVNVTDSTGGNAFAYTLPSGATVPCVAPPYGALAAVDVNNGEIAWRVPLGRNESLAELGEEGLNAGVHSIGGSIATASGLVFIGATVDRRFRAFDARTGEELWVTELPANAHATPITYMGRDGAQYVVVAAAGGGPAAREQAVSDALIAFRLPQ